jgi:conjugal transfer pilus assembly protein TraK
VATGSEAPVTLYIADADSPEEALALTLAPRRIPPREVRLLLAGTTGKPRANPGAAARWEDAQPYVETLVFAFRDLARNRVPSGYGLRRPARSERVRCATAGLDATTGQALDGNGLLLLIARVRNTSKTHREIDERTCTAGTTPVAAVAAWPRLWLGPGEATELYLAVRPRDAERERRDRPSLLGGRP